MILKRFADKMPNTNLWHFAFRTFGWKVHGNTPDEVKQDLEGMQNMRAIGRNMAWLLKCIEAGKNAGVALPEQEEKIKTNYIR